jgi:hypothetical protein
MLGMKRTAAIVALVLLAGGLMVGCEDTPLTAPSDGEVRLAASPSTVRIDTTLPDDEQYAESRITAQVFDGNGRIMQGANVVFTASDGTLASGGPPNSLKTDANGIAVDTLTVVSGDDASIEVGATSGPLTQTVTVTKNEGAGNVEPTAKLLASPSNQATKDQPVVFDGRSSSDPDGTITCYQFQIDSTVDASDEIVQGPALSSIQRTYDTEQTLTVTLRVSDAEDADQWCIQGGSPAPASNFSSATDFINGYEILCSNGPSITITSSAPTLQYTGGDVGLRGFASDTGAELTTYSWDCGNQSEDPDPGDPDYPGQVPANGNITGTCRYEVNNLTTSVTYTVTLQVNDVCGEYDIDTLTVTVLGRP